MPKRSVVGSTKTPSGSDCYPFPELSFSFYSILVQLALEKEPGTEGPKTLPAKNDSDILVANVANIKKETKTQRREIV